MPGFNQSTDTLATKLVSVYPENNNVGMPSHMAYIMKFDAKTGRLQAVSNLSLSLFIHSEVDAKTGRLQAVSNLNLSLSIHSEVDAKRRLALHSGNARLNIKSKGNYSLCP